MGCGNSTPQQPPHEVAAAGGAQDKNRSPNNTKLLSCLIRRRVDSIRRRRKRVGDAITMETTLSSANSPDNDDTSHVVVVEAVWRAIEDVLLSEEREYAAMQVLDKDTSVSSKDVVKRQMSVPQSPSFRVYCTRGNSFDSNHSSTKDNNDNVVKDVEKTKQGRHKSMDTGSNKEEGSTTSSKSKIEAAGPKGEITKKAGSNWKLGSPLGMKNLFVMSCYSCSPQNRDRLVSRG